MPFDEPFNYSRKMNLGALHSTGTASSCSTTTSSSLSDRWLENLVAPLDDLDVGMTGAKLFYSSDTIQHAGHSYDKGQYLHAFLGEPRALSGPFRGPAHQPRGQRRDGRLLGDAP